MRKVVVSDVDGVLSTGQFLYDTTGKVFKIFGAHDTDGVKLLKSNNIDLFFVSADKHGFGITSKRISDIGCSVTLVSEQDRYSYINNLYGLSNVIYIGDGYYDAKILRDCAYGICPKSGRIEAKMYARYVTPSNAGEGAFLDACIKIIEDERYV